MPGPFVSPCFTLALGKRAEAMASRFFFILLYLPVHLKPKFGNFPGY